MQVIAQQQALLANGGRPGGQQPVPANSAAPQQQQQVMGLAQQQGMVAPTVGQPGLGGGQQRQPGGQTGLGQQFSNQMSGPYAGHMQVCATLKIECLESFKLKPILTIEKVSSRTVDSAHCTLIDVLLLHPD